MSLSHYSEEVIASWHQAITKVTQSFWSCSTLPKSSSLGWWFQSVMAAKCFSSAGFNVTVKFTMFSRHQLHYQVQRDFNYIRDGNDFAFPALPLWISLPRFFAYPLLVSFTFFIQSQILILSEVNTSYYKMLISQCQVFSQSSRMGVYHFLNLWKGNY